MAEEYSHGNQSYGNEAANGVGVHGDAAAATETKDRGVFDFLAKKEETKPQSQVISCEGYTPKIDGHDEDGETKKEGFLAKLQRSNSSSSSSSDEEEVGEGGEKKKKDKKGLKEKIKEKICGEGEGDQKSEASEHENKKGLVENIKEKLHGGHEEQKKEDEGCHVAEDQKKGILEKIKEKLPGYHPKTEEEKEKEGHASY